MARIFIFGLLLTVVYVSARAAVFVEAAYSKPTADGKRAEVKVGLIPLPDYPASGEVRVAMKCTQICQSDRRILNGTKKSEALIREIVLGHEGVGKIVDLSPEVKESDLTTGSYVVVLPHYVPDNDPSIKMELPNLSPNMKHIGFAMHGVFAEQMDFPKYNIFPIPQAKEQIRQFGENRFLEQMVNAEPLACVQRAFKLLDEKRSQTLQKNQPRILILGAGPMGLLHALHARAKYSDAKVFSYDIHPSRRKLAQSILGNNSVLNSTIGLQNTFDVVVTSTSSAEANSVDAPNLVKNGGVILLFSGLNLRANELSPKISEVNIESVHRGEQIVEVHDFHTGSAFKNFTLLGSSGYTKADIATSISELAADLMQQQPVYSKVTTSRISGLSRRTVEDLSGRNRHIEFDSPALAQLLEFESPEVFEHQKISVRFVNKCSESFLK